MGLLLLSDFGINKTIEVNLTNRVYGNTVIKRKGIVDMNYTTIHSAIVLNVTIQCWSQGANDTYDIYLGNTESFRDTNIQITANNNYLVEAGFDPNEPDPANPVYPYAAEAGKLLGKVSDLLVNEQTRELDSSLAGRNVMKEFDFYRFMAATQNVNIDSMIINKVLEDDQKNYDTLYSTTTTTTTQP